MFPLYSVNDSTFWVLLLHVIQKDSYLGLFEYLGQLIIAPFEHRYLLLLNLLAETVQCT